MINDRIKYFTLTGWTIFLGLLSRKIAFVPAYVGDALWAIMVYFIIRFIWTRGEIKASAIVGLLLCYLVEVGQLYQADWIIGIRTTLPGRLLLGQGFLWSDILAYTVGILLVSRFDLRNKFDKSN